MAERLPWDFGQLKATERRKQGSHGVTKADSSRIRGIAEPLAQQLARLLLHGSAMARGLSLQPLMQAIVNISNDKSCHHHLLPHELLAC